MNTTYYTTKGVGGQGSRPKPFPKAQGFCSLERGRHMDGGDRYVLLARHFSPAPPILSSVQTRQKSFDDVELNVL